MIRNKEATIKKILHSAEKEFADNGFEKSSIRIIAKNAGVTPGAIYKHFKSKDDIFESIVSPTIERLYIRLKELTDESIEEIILKGVLEFENKSNSSNREMLLFTYDNFDIFNLLFNCSKGTKYENIRNDLVEFEVAGAKKLISELKKQKIVVNNLSDNELHVLYTIACTPLFEIITHKYSYENALRFIDVMEDAMKIGWKRILK